MNFYILYTYNLYNIVHQLYFNVKNFKEEIINHDGIWNLLGDTEKVVLELASRLSQL